MNRKVNFRHIAKARLSQAKIELESGNDERLKYAALELRMAIEGVTYDRAMAFKDEIPPSEFGTWQPKKLMRLLLDIDPDADQTVTVSFSEEIQPGVPTKEWHTLGTDKVFNLRSIRTHYDALGSFVHLLSIKQFEAGQAHDWAKIRKRCEVIVAELEKVLASPIYNMRMKGVATLNCMRCHLPVRKHFPHSAQIVQAECLECGALYDVKKADAPGEVEWLANTVDFQCRADNCSTVIAIWRDHIKVGARFQCPSCLKQYIVQLVAMPFAELAPGDPAQG
ncbi:hypothetical protein [Peristeroidobacter soli]|uniref:hypothetical protein n=1 Tax=Peristeroidobacter soli TaxID=2497877 RepID=UPI00101C36FE|nr:hypothetical protein [Peristeroidobacter soli]